MKTLAEQTCQPCQSGEQPLTEKEYATYMAQLDGWQIEEVAGIPRLNKTFTFKNFTDALDFTNAVGDIAETADHHPALLTEWGKVQVSWWTHSISGLHHNDFILAARTDELYG